MYDEPYEAMRTRLERNWRHSARGHGDAITRQINCMESDDKLSLSGIERDLIVYAMAGELSDDKEAMRQRTFRLSPEDQYWLACMVAENVGYVLVPEGHMMTPLEDRVSRLEAAVRELNPGAAL